MGKKKRRRRSLRRLPEGEVKAPSQTGSRQKRRSPLPLKRRRKRRSPRRLKRSRERRKSQSRGIDQTPADQRMRRMRKSQSRRVEILAVIRALAEKKSASRERKEDKK